MALTQRLIGVRKAKSRLQYDNKLDSLVKASKKMSKAIKQNSEAIMKRNEVQTEKNAINTRLADDKIMFTNLSSISDPAFHEFIKNEQIRILRKRAEERPIDMYGQGSQYHASQYQGSGEGVQNQGEGSQNQWHLTSIMVLAETNGLFNLCIRF